MLLVELTGLALAFSLYNELSKLASNELKMVTINRNGIVEVENEALFFKNLGIFL